MQKQRRAIEGEGSMAWNVQEPGDSQAPLPESDFLSHSPSPVSYGLEPRDHRKVNYFTLALSLGALPVLLLCTARDLANYRRAHKRAFF